MRVAVDATALVSGNTGVARYASGLLGELARLDDLDIAAFAIGRGRPAPEGVRHLRIPLRFVHRTWRHLGSPSAERLVGSVAVVHSLDMVPPPTRAPVVMTVHDLLPLRLPHLYSPRSRAIAAAHAEAARRAAVVVADCASTADEIASLLGRSREHFAVAPPGPGITPLPGAEERPVAAPYVLGVGALTPRKGFADLAVAMSRLGHDTPLLVHAGPDGWRAEEVREAMRAALGERVRFLGWVSEDELVALYRHALVLAHPSVAEGFGFPVLEAMALGSPVIAADIPSVREITSGAALVVPKASPEAFAGALALALSDEGLRDRLVADGLARASTYTWAATASSVADAYARAVRT